MTDRQRLFELQALYKSGQKKALSDMYALLYTIAYKTINRISCGNESVAGLSASERQQKAHDAVTYMIEQYLTRPDFMITESMTGYLFQRIRHELHYMRKCDELLDYRDEMPTEVKTKTEYIYSVKDTTTGEVDIFETSEELFQNPRFKRLPKWQLAQCIREGQTWKHYVFELLERGA